MLVDYSDSEGSEGSEEKAKLKPTAKTSIPAHKPAFQKVIDRSNPRKIIVSLPEPTKVDENDEANETGPPMKRAKVGGGAFGGFNTFLPPPKRAAASNGESSSGAIKKGGLGSGVSLKTGAAPGFSREPVPDTIRDEENDGLADSGITSSGEVLGMAERKFPEASLHTADGLDMPKEEPKKQGNPMMFKPLSVARKPQKKKLPSTTAVTTQSPQHSVKSSTATVSLFSMEGTSDRNVSDAPSVGDYRPLMYEAPTNGADHSSSYAPAPDQEADPNTAGVSIDPSASTLRKVAPQSLDSIASDLNLSASAKRQLLGRQRNTKGNSSAVNIVNFNIDEEYASNELLRQAGEQVQHNPVRAIAAGKHSLKQLVNAASNQKDALEEQFASGRRNKKESGSKYGW
ncbi:hypothetical protein MMC24_000705 [Lignoscripta atroalba]|nr:hypothetical protein [Lignoscripta atroalba]